MTVISVTISGFHVCYIHFEWYLFNDFNFVKLQFKYKMWKAVSHLNNELIRCLQVLVGHVGGAMHQIEHDLVDCGPQDSRTLCWKKLKTLPLGWFCFRTIFKALAAVL